MRRTFVTIKMLKIIFLLLGILILSACTSAQAEQADIVLTNDIDLDGKVAVVEATESVNPTRPVMVEPEHVVVTLDTTSTPEPTLTKLPTMTATETPSLINQVGSPLMQFSLEELSEIIYKGISNDSQISDRGHYGVDFLYYNLEGKGESILGTAITASFPGKVVSMVEFFEDTDLGFPYGNMVIVETPLSAIDPDVLTPADPPENGSLYVLYAHMIERPYVEMGDYVMAGQVLGKVGSTGDSDAPHLHWEMRFGPSYAVFGYMTYYNTRATVAQMEAYERWRMSGEFVYFDPMLLIPSDSSE